MIRSCVTCLPAWLHLLDLGSRINTTNDGDDVGVRQARGGKCPGGVDHGHGNAMLLPEARSTAAAYVIMAWLGSRHVDDGDLAGVTDFRPARRDACVRDAGRLASRKVFPSADHLRAWQ